MPPEKYANKTPFMRFLHKNTGWLILGASLVLLLVWWNSMQIEQNFYDSWTCPMLYNFQNGGATYKGKMFDELEQEHQSGIQQLFRNECNIMDFEKG